MAKVDYDKVLPGDVVFLNVLVDEDTHLVEAHVVKNHHNAKHGLDLFTVSPKEVGPMVPQGVGGQVWADVPHGKVDDKGRVWVFKAEAA